MTKKNKIKISEINIHFLPNPTSKGILAYTNFVINNTFKINNVAIGISLKRKGDFRLIYPITKCYSGKFIQAFYPIQKEVADKIEKEVIKVYKTILQNEKLDR